METIKLTKNNFNEIIERVSQTMKKGGVVVTPSETQYGLSCDPTSKMAVRKTFAIKNRELNIPLALVAGDQTIIEDHFLINEIEQQIMDKFWPGPVTLLLTPRANETIKQIARLTLGSVYNTHKLELNKIAVRIPGNKFLRSLSQGLHLPIISTSANISGQPACYDIECVTKQLANSKIQPDLIIDAGHLTETPPSSIINLSSDSYQVIRPGAEFQKIEKFLNKLL